MRDYERQKAIAKALLPIASEDAFWEAGFLLDYMDTHPDCDGEVLLRRRLTGEPLQYVLGEWDFMGLSFRVDARALIPRPDTEVLCEKALSLLHGGERVLDLCCGSGCIGIALAKRRNIQLVSADISEDALALAQENAERNGVVLSTVQSDLFDAIAGKFDLIVCNPPYLSEEEMRTMDASLRYEPQLALYGGADGLDFYRRIQRDYRQYLTEHGRMLLEIGYRQEQAVCALFDARECIYDYGKRPRCVVVEKR